MIARLREGRGIDRCIAPAQHERAEAVNREAQAVLRQHQGAVLIGEGLLDGGAARIHVADGEGERRVIGVHAVRYGNIDGVWRECSEGFLADGIAVFIGQVELVVQRGFSRLRNELGVEEIRFA